MTQRLVATLVLSLVAFAAAVTTQIQPSDQQPVAIELGSSCTDHGDDKLAFVDIVT